MIPELLGLPVFPNVVPELRSATGLSGAKALERISSSVVSVRERSLPAQMFISGHRRLPSLFQSQTRHLFPLLSFLSGGREPAASSNSCPSFHLPRNERTRRPPQRRPALLLPTSGRGGVPVMTFLLLLLVWAGITRVPLTVPRSLERSFSASLPGKVLLFAQESDRMHFSRKPHPPVCFLGDPAATCWCWGNANSRPAGAGGSGAGLARPRLCNEGG